MIVRVLQELNVGEKTASKFLPFVLQSFDVEAQRRGDGAHILAVKLLQDGRFTCVIQSSASPRLKN